MIWVIKEEGQNWDGQYFREIILEQHVFPFLRNEENVLDVNEVVFLHDKAPCFKAMQTQELFRNSGIDFFDNTQWPGNSPDLNPCENVGAIIKDKVEDQLHRNPDRLRRETLQNILTDVLHTLEDDTELFERLLRSF